MPPSSPHILLEVAIASVEDAVAAEAGGADRVELNAALACGGLTPSLGTVLEVRQATRLPIFAVVRPRRAGFCYSLAEFRVIQRDLEVMLAHGAAGVVLGVLKADGTVDVPRCSQLVAQAGGRPVVFHRAFDLTPEPATAMEQLIDLGFCRIMTSGQAETALHGAECITGLLRQAAGRIEVLPAGGVNPATAADVVARTGCNQIHAGLRALHQDRPIRCRQAVRFNARTLSEEDFEITDAHAVRRVRAELDAPR
jgi:copper homeostasis protein